jgi:CheY-like chemotaxis protein
VRTLVAEDHTVNQRLAVRLLEKRGYQVEVVGTGQVALAVIDRLLRCMMRVLVGPPFIDRRARLSVATACLAQPELAHEQRRRWLRRLDHLNNSCRTA